MEIYNYMEKAVETVIDQLLPGRKDVCKCEKCRLDIKAWALNRLPSRYVVSNKGFLYTKLEEVNLQFRTDIVREVTKAIGYIKAHPRH